MTVCGPVGGAAAAARVMTPIPVLRDAPGVGRLVFGGCGNWRPGRGAGPMEPDETLLAMPSGWCAPNDRTCVCGGGLLRQHECTLPELDEPMLDLPAFTGFSNFVAPSRHTVHTRSEAEP